MDTAEINDVVYKIRWEELVPEPNKPFGPGPVGEYVEVVDFDPTIGANGTLYAPVDLNDAYILANDGWPPAKATRSFTSNLSMPHRC